MARKSKTNGGALGRSFAAQNGQSRIADAPPADLVDTEGGGGQSAVVASDLSRRAAPPSVTLAEIIDRVRYWHRQRVFAMEQRKRIDLALGSFLRLMLGWSKDKPEAERKKIAAAAAALIDEGDSEEWGAVIAASVAAREPFDAIEARAVKEMSALAIGLPAWKSFGEGIRGFGPASLAVIVAEAGDLSNYANPGKLWKRMGIAVMDGVRQGGLAKNASAEAWIAHGYNRMRRSRMWNIGDALIKGNRDGYYRTVYLDRKKKELARDPEMKPIKAHRRAQRYMEKRLLRNLWSAWRRAANSVQPNGALSVASSSVQAERSAVRNMSSSRSMPSAAIPAKAGERRASNALQPNVGMPAASSSAQAERSAKVGMTAIRCLPSASIEAAS